MTVTTPSPRSAPDTVSQVSLPQDARALSSLGQIDYADAFLVTAPVQRTPRQWVDSVLSDAPTGVRTRLVLGWCGLGLKLGAPWSADRVLGWKVQHADRQFVRLAADSWLGLHAQLLFCAEPRGLLFATVIQYTSPVGRLLWPAITPRHQRVVRSLLRRAAAREQSR